MIKYLWRVYYFFNDMKQPKDHIGIGKSRTIIRFCRINGVKINTISMGTSKLKVD